jgi:hypothetical protein
MTPARRHFQSVTASVESAAAATAAPPPPLQGRMLAMLHAHQVNLKAIKSRKAKIEAKRGFLPEYAAYVDGVLTGGAGGDDLVLVTLMVWSIDVGDYPAALAIAAYAIRHRLELPATFRRDLQTTLVEEIADAALLTLATAEPLPSGTADALDHALDLTEGADMPDEVRAKAYKVLGQIRRDTDPGAALRLLRLALSFDQGCGVKTDIGKLERQLAGAAPTGETETGGAP